MKDQVFQKPWWKRVRLLLLMTAVALPAGGCGFFKKTPPPPPPEPARIVLEIESCADINLNAKGRPSPIALRIYQLRTFRRFKKAGFLPLYHYDEKVLGKDLHAKQEVMLKPNEKKTIYIEPDDAVRTIGLFAVFRQFETAQWKAAVGVVPHKFRLLNINLTGNRLTLQ